MLIFVIKERFATDNIHRQIASKNDTKIPKHIRTTIISYFYSAFVWILELGIVGF